MVKLLALGTACMVLAAACGSQHKAAPMAASSPAESAMPNDPHTEIERRYAEIEAERGRLQLPEPAAPASAGAAEPMATVPSSTDGVCKPATTDRCTQSCELSDSICTNAGRICDLAAQLPQDTWAADTCARAKVTCDAAHDACCTCQ